MPGTLTNSAPLRFFTLDEFAEFFRISRRTAERMVQDGRLPAVHIGQKLRIAREVVDRIQATGVPAVPPGRSQSGGAS